MASPRSRENIELALTLIAAAPRYWLDVFPRFCHEARRWQRRAQLIPDPGLREIALEAQRIKRGNMEGAVAFAAFSPVRHLPTVVTAQVAFQAAYDYADSLAEQQHENPSRNANQLHQALLATVIADPFRVDYYAYSQKHDDGGYLEEIVATCRQAFFALPSYPSVLVTLRRFVERIVCYQSTNLTESQGGHEKLARWATIATPPNTDLRWWETAASAGSSLAVFALIAEAARTCAPSTDAIAIETAYLWIGALHSLLDSVVDLREDIAAGQRSLLDFYTDARDAAVRMGTLAAESQRLARALPRGKEHCLMLAAMTSHYLSRREATTCTATPIAGAVLAELGALARITMAIFKIRRSAITSTARSR